MRDLELEKTLRQWAEDMVKRYTWLTIRFEYNEKRRAYLISYSPESKADEDERFVIESSAFEDRINEQYDGLKAPLFCYEERLFKLSPTAEVIRHHKPENNKVWTRWYSTCLLISKERAQEIKYAPQMEPNNQAAGCTWGFMQYPPIAY